MFNATIPLQNPLDVPDSFVGESCIYWCKEQHFIHEGNEIVKGIYIITISLIVLFVYMVVSNVDMKDKEDKRFVMKLLIEASFYLQLGFMFWFLWFK